MNHTPEPWDDDLAVLGCGATAQEALANQTRANVCVTAMAGIEDPATFVEDAKAMKMRRDHEGALVARMHAAAVGEVRGPRLGVVEDIEALRKSHDAAVNALKASRDAFSALAEINRLPSGWDVLVVKPIMDALAHAQQIGGGA